jgi:MinD-like ATPase involved in chromosome partitioning or flagellar assembly
VSPDGILIAAAGQAWESRALEVLEAARRPVLKRCVDLTDLLASATTGQAGVAVLSDQLMGLDADAVTRLLRADVRPIVVGEHDLGSIGIQHFVPTGQVEALVAAIEATVDTPLVQDPEDLDVLPDSGSRGQVVVVHGPNGAPGRTLLATTLAAMRARSSPTVLIDVDPQAGAIAQSLGVLDEVSGLLAAARLANAGGLDRESFARCRRRISQQLDVLTGLPRADRWMEIRSGVIAQVLELSRGVGDVLVDSGFSLEDDTDFGRAVGRNQATIDSVAEADRIVLVGGAEPVGLSRLTRSLVGLADHSEAPIHVVVNRMRDSLGWKKQDIQDLILTYASPSSIDFVPFDLSNLDKSLISGKSLVELGSSPILKALEPVVRRMFPE